MKKKIVISFCIIIICAFVGCEKAREEMQYSELNDWSPTVVETEKKVEDDIINVDDEIENAIITFQETRTTLQEIAKNNLEFDSISVHLKTNGTRLSSDNEKNIRKIVEDSEFYTDKIKEIKILYAKDK